MVLRQEQDLMGATVEKIYTGVKGKLMQTTQGLIKRQESSQTQTCLATIALSANTTLLGLVFAALL